MWAMVIFGEGRYAVTIPTELGRTGERHLLRKMLPSVFFLMRGFPGIISDVQNAGKRSKDRKVKTMPDYIERAAVEHMLEAAQIISDGEYCGYCTEDVRLSEIPSVDVESVRRTSVDEKLPHAEYGESDSVLVVTKLGSMHVLCFDGGNWCYPTGEPFIRTKSRVTHWMPLPEED